MKGHERMWHGHNRPVDKGLKDEWLEAMNALYYFCCYSSCEGHANPTGTGASRFPRIWLRMTDQILMPRIVSLWNQEAVEALVRKWFPPRATDGFVCIDSLIKGGRGVCLHLTCKTVRSSDAMAPAIEQWFDHTTRALAPFEREFTFLFQLSTFH